MKPNIRPEFHPSTELEKFIGTTVEAHYGEYGYNESEVFFSNHMGVTIGVVKTHEMEENFHKFWKALSEKITPKMVENGYSVLKPWEYEECVVLNYVKIPENAHSIKKSDELSQFIENAIDRAYEEYQETSTAVVHVYDKKEIQVWINSENPYLGAKFWKLLDTVEIAIDERLKQEGYTYQKTEYMYDFMIWHYAYKTESSKT